MAKTRSDRRGAEVSPFPRDKVSDSEIQKKKEEPLLSRWSHLSQNIAPSFPSSFIEEFIGLESAFFY